MQIKRKIGSFARRHRTIAWTLSFLGIAVPIQIVRHSISMPFQLDFIFGFLILLFAWKLAEDLRERLARW